MDASKFTPEYFNDFGKGTLPEHLGIVITSVKEGEIVAEIAVTGKHLAPNGFLHAGSVVTLADTACGYACFSHLPAGAQNFTTIELKSNHLGTAREGVVVATAKAVPGARLVMYPDMGHDLPRPRWPDIFAEIRRTADLAT